MSLYTSSKSAGSFGCTLEEILDRFESVSRRLRKIFSFDMRKRRNGAGTGVLGLLLGAWVLCLSSLCGSVNAREFIVLSQEDNAIYRIGLPLGEPALIGGVEVGADPIELIEATAAELYTFDRAENIMAIIDRATGEVTGRTVLDQDVWRTRRGFDLSPSGVLFGILPEMQLRTIDPATGTTTFIANVTGAARVEAIAFAPDGTLYAAGSLDDNGSSETLFTLSIDSGELLPVGPMEVADLDVLAFGGDGYLYGVDSEAGVMTHLLRINPSSGEVQDLGSTGVAAITGLVAVRQPALSLARLGNELMVSWPTNASDFQLEHSERVGPSANWEPVAAAPQVIEGEYVFTQEMTSSEQLFFRLRR